MAVRVEIVNPIDKRTDTSRTILNATHEGVSYWGDEPVFTKEYRGDCEWLVVYGIGRPPRSEWRDEHVRRGGKVLLWDLGYFGRRKVTGFLRASINDDHPQNYLDRTAPDPSRFDRHEIRLREDFDPDGPIVLVGLGRKSHVYIRTEEWERRKLDELRRRFPTRRIVYRPKPDNVVLPLDAQVEQSAPIETLLRGASLVVCRHSNVAVDAVVAGVPFEAEQGAATWLSGKPYTAEHRLDFLRRLCWWQWTPTEAPLAWRFVKEFRP